MWKILVQEEKIQAILTLGIFPTFKHLTRPDDIMGRNFLSRLRLSPSMRTDSQGPSERAYMVESAEYVSVSAVYSAHRRYHLV